MRADFVVLSKSLLDPGQGDDISTELPTVLQTFVDGLCVYGCH